MAIRGPALRRAVMISVIMKAARSAPRSERRPHRCELIEKGYFRRSGSSSRLMEHFEIEDAFKRATVADLELEHSITSLGVRAGGQGALIGIKLNLSNRSGASARFPYLMFRASGWKTKQS